MTNAQSGRLLTEPTVLHETPAWLVLGKPSHWHSVAKGRKADRAWPEEAPQPDVETWLGERFEWARALPEAGLVHRLDFETSGCLMVAKSEPGIEKWRAAFQTGDSVEKIYLALSRPGLSREGEFDLYFTSRHKRSKKITVSEEGEPRHLGRCTWEVLKASPQHDLVQVQIIGPGRRHQIRAGLEYLGHPLLGDEFYGGRPFEHGLALHAWKLVIGGTAVTAPPPPWGASI